MLRSFGYLGPEYRVVPFGVFTLELSQNGFIDWCGTIGKERCHRLGVLSHIRKELGFSIFLLKDFPQFSMVLCWCPGCRLEFF